MTKATQLPPSTFTDLFVVRPTFLSVVFCEGLKMFGPIAKAAQPRGTLPPRRVTSFRESMIRLLEEAQRGGTVSSDPLQSDDPTL